MREHVPRARHTHTCHKAISVRRPRCAHGPALVLLAKRYFVGRYALALCSNLLTPLNIPLTFSIHTHHVGSA